MKLVIRAVGRLRDRPSAALCEDYLARLRRHLPVQSTEVERDAQLVPGDEPRAVLVALDPEGRAFSTAELRKWFEQHMNHGTHALVFLIGGADGHTAENLARVHERLSLSRLTFPHRLARVILCEQLYRVVSAIRGEPYDK